MKKVLIILSVLISTLVTLLCLDRLFEEERKLKLAELEVKRKRLQEERNKMFTWRNASRIDELLYKRINRDCVK